MMNGVSMESASATATFASVAGSWDADYPVTNLRDLRTPSEVGRSTGASVGFTAVLSADAQVQMVAMAAHNIAAGSWRVRLYSDAAMSTMVADSGTNAIWSTAPTQTDIAWTTPWIFGAAHTTRAVRIDLTSLSGTTEIGGVEIAQFWDWMGTSPGIDVGIVDASQDQQLLGGGAEGIDERPVRAVDGQLSLLALATATTRAIDFQAMKQDATPFVYVADYDDPDSFERECYLARNAELPPMVGAIYRHDTFQVRLREHVE